MTENTHLGSSFRDPSGFLFVHQGVLYRQINHSYRPHYDALVASGLFDRLIRSRHLIPHQEVDVQSADPALAYKIIQPELVDFISYPYEWCFSQLKDAALATLAVQKMALQAGFTLKDSSAYNIQFHRGRPVLIDSLSLEIYQEGQPWAAYRQFCQHFLAPLALMAWRDVRLSQLLRVYIDGLPLDLASRLLPWRTRLDFGLLTHLHLHASLQSRPADAPARSVQRRPMLSKVSLLGLIDSLEAAVKKLRWKGAETQWGEYYQSHAGHYSTPAFQQKRQVVQDFLAQARPRRVWDMGANTGVFSRIASQQHIPTLAFDIDPLAVEKNYLECTANQEEWLLPLVLDLTNPSASLGWNNAERMSLAQRAPADAALALALIHHLAISNNVPLEDVCAFFSGICHWLVIEFVPKEDPQAQKLLTSRPDIFTEYTQEHFEAVFQQRFRIHAKVALQDSPRTLYLMETS